MSVSETLRKWLGDGESLLGEITEVEKATLSTKDRKDLSDSDFVFPETRSYPIPDAAHARNALARVAQDGTPEQQAKVRAAVKRKFPDIDVSKAEFEVLVPIIKADTQQIVYGVVMSPEVTDSQGDTVSAADIEKAAHGFLGEYVNSHDVQHSDVVKDEKGNPIARTVESYIAPVDFELGGQKVLKGAWVQAVRIDDAATWAKVEKGEITGFSIAGTGTRLPD